MERRIVTTSRECPGRLVPTGDPITVPASTFVTLTQSLGGAYTIIFNGNMVRIDGADADAIGLEPTFLEFEPPSDGQVDKAQVIAAISSVYDPEIPVNVWDLGLIYNIDIRSKGRITLQMTLTSPGCGMGPVLVEELKSRVSQVPFVTDVQIELVFEPPWSRDRMSEEAQLELGLF